MSFVFIPLDADILTKQQLVVRNFMHPFPTSPLAIENIKSHFNLYIQLAAAHGNSIWLKPLEEQLSNEIARMLKSMPGNYASLDDFKKHFNARAYTHTLPLYSLYVMLTFFQYHQNSTIPHQDRDVFFLVDYLVPLSCWRDVHIASIPPLDLSGLIAELPLKNALYYYSVQKILGGECYLEEVLFHMLPSHIRPLLQFGAYEEAWLSYDTTPQTVSTLDECSLIF